VSLPPFVAQADFAPYSVMLRKCFININKLFPYFLFHVGDMPLGIVVLTLQVFV
jgi:hypothetical protein